MAADAFRLDKFLPMRLSILAHRLRRAAAEVYSARFHLSAAEWRTIAVLGHYGSLDASAVSKHAAVDKVLLSQAVGRLTAAGYLVHRRDPENRRRIILDLSPSDSALYRQLVPLVRAVEEAIVGGLDQEDRARFERILGKLETAAQ